MNVSLLSMPIGRSAQYARSRSAAISHKPSVNRQSWGFRLRPARLGIAAVGGRRNRAPQLRVTVEARHELRLAPGALGAHDLGERTSLRRAPFRETGNDAYERRPSPPRAALALRPIAPGARAEQPLGLRCALALAALAIRAEAAREEIRDAEAHGRSEERRVGKGGGHRGAPA